MVLISKNKIRTATEKTAISLAPFPSPFFQLL